MLLELFNSNGRCFELGRAGLGIDGIDREVVGRHLIVEMKRQKSKPGPEPGVEANGRYHRAAARADANSLSFAKVVERSIFGREIERFVAAQRRSIASGLHSGVVGIEAAAGGEADRILLVQLIYRRFKFRRAERCAGAEHWSLPQAAVEIQFARMGFVVAWPLDAAELFEARVTHARVHGT